MVVSTPRSTSASCTRSEAAGSSATRRVPGAQIAHLTQMLEIVIRRVGRVLRESDRPEMTRESGPCRRAARQTAQECERVGARLRERLQICAEIACAVIA